MHTFACACGNRLYFENTECLACGRNVGWCPVCRSIAPLVESSEGRLTCGNAQCGTSLVKCRNYAVENVCNRLVSVASAGDDAAPLCDSCRLTEVIPDLSIAGNPKKWYRLEVAKRRLLYLLDFLHLPYGRAEDGVTPPLSFDFKSDAIPTAGVWRTMTTERVYTGHQNGKITINIREADDVEREKLRVDMNEAHRTLSGHFRHEIGHYYWQMLVAGRFEADFKQTFGDHEFPTYAEALETYYRNGPPADWRSTFVSAYAAMHPWEDFAETFALHLDMIDVLDTANHSDLTMSIDIESASPEEIIERYLKLGLAANELNRSMGLVDLVPEVLTPAVCTKLAFIHRLVRGAARPPESAPSPSYDREPVAGQTSNRVISR